MALRRFIQRALPFVGLVFFFGALVVVSPVLTENSHAAIGDGGDQMGGSGGAQTRNGWGWYSYRIGGDKKPDGFRDGTRWNDVVNICTSEGATHVIAFIVLNKSGSDGNNGIVYRYKSSWMSPLLSQYRGNAGGNWLTLNQAKDRYDLVDANDKKNFTWGTNVAWFCYTEGSYTLSTHSYVSTDAGSWGAAGRDIYVSPGTTVYFSHTVKNDGNLTAIFKKRHDTYDGSWSESAWSGNSSLGGGDTWRRSTETFSVPGGADDGKKYCRRYNASRTSSSDGTNIQSTRACVIVRYVWSVTPSTTITSPAATNRPGQTLTWQHKITNGGPDSTRGTLTYRAQNQGSRLGTGVVSTWTTTNLTKNASAQQNSTHTITQDDVGTQLCRRTTVSPGSSVSSATKNSANACRDIPYNYVLTPTVELSRDEGQPGSEFSVKGSVGSTNITKSKPTEWRFSYVFIEPGKGTPGGGTTAAATNPCNQYTGDGVTCAPAGFSSGGDGTGSGLVIAATGYSFGLRYSSIQDLKVGTKVCYGLSVKDRASSSTEWRHSTLDCMVVSKRPLVHITGGDLLAGRSAPAGSVSTNTKVISGKIYGSYAEYGVVSSGLISNMGSADGYAGGPSLNPLLVPCNVGNLTFSNRPLGGGACATGSVGNYNFGGVTPAIASRFPVTSATPAVEGVRDISTQLNAKTVYRSATGVQLSASADIAPGNWYVIHAPTATVVITGNIQYSNNPISSAEAIPQVVIIAQNIIIKDTVTRVDAWLVATGTGAEGRINTCGAGTGITQNTLPHAGQCADPLRVNGPVVANHLIMRRTAGAGPGAASGEPAEAFNLRPDAYMWASAVQNDTAKARTVLVTELPPRF